MECIFGKLNSLSTNTSMLLAALPSSPALVEIVKILFMVLSEYISIMYLYLYLYTVYNI